MNHYLLFATKPGYMSILRPLQQAIEARGDRVAWFIPNPKHRSFVPDGAVCLQDTESVNRFNPLAVFAPGNWVPDFFPGVKVQVFHDVGFTKKGRFHIRGLFDLYCTCGPRITKGFAEIAARHPHCAVIETGWPKLDPLFQTEPSQDLSNETDQRTRILFAPTFSPSLTSAPLLLPEIKALSASGEFHWTVKFHDRMDDATKSKYRALQGPNLVVAEEPSILEELQRADIMLSDTSSVIVEFLLLGKPVVTFRNLEPDAYMLNFEQPEDLQKALLSACNASEETSRHAREFVETTHPYRDGKSSERVLDALEHFVEHLQGGLRAKPLNLWRKFNIRRAMGYFRLGSLLPPTS